MSDDLLCFWQGKSNAWPRLSKRKKQVLSVPTTSTSSEWSFSVGGATITKQRTELNADNACFRL